MITTQLRILAIDDQQGILAALQDDLEEAGHRVFTADNGVAGLALAGQIAPDLILLDVRMPGMDGLQVLRTLQQNPATAIIPVILLTGEPDIELMKQAFLLGATDYLRKPYNVFELQTRVSHQVRLKQATDQIYYLMERQKLEAERQTRYTRSTFQRYLSPQVVEQLLIEPGNPLSQSQRKYVTVLFSDIQGFTDIAEELPAEQVVNILNDYLEQMAEVVFRNHGLLDKYMGDGLMAWWGYRVPNDPREEAFRAIKTAIEMQQKMHELRAQWHAQGIAPLTIRIGINSGEAIIGNIGSNQKMDFTAIGDTVNLASRLESLNGEFNTQMMIGESTYGLVKDRIQANYVAAARVKGKAQDVQVYELLGLADPSSPAPRPAAGSHTRA